MQKNPAFLSVSALFALLAAGWIGTLVLGLIGHEGIEPAAVGTSLGKLLLSMFAWANVLAFLFKRTRALRRRGNDLVVAAIYLGVIGMSHLPLLGGFSDDALMFAAGGMLAIAMTDIALRRAFPNISTTEHA